MTSKGIELIRFDRDDVHNVLSKLSKEDLDKLGFGAVQLDQDGVVRAFNQRESDITGKNPEKVIGRHFFGDIAPCTNSDDFLGRFEKIKRGELDSAIFEYTFDHEMRPTRVMVHMKPAAESGRYWLLINRL